MTIGGYKRIQIRRLPVTCCFYRVPRCSAVGFSKYQCLNSNGTEGWAQVYPLITRFPFDLLLIFSTIRIHRFCVCARREIWFQFICKKWDFVGCSILVYIFPNYIQGQLCLDYELRSLKSWFDSCNDQGAQLVSYPIGNGCYYRILTMVYNFQKYWVFGLYPSSWSCFPWFVF
jgi:hypothetical protein